jgi:PAS domain S-box-containing protein
MGSTGTDRTTVEELQQRLLAAEVDLTLLRRQMVEAQELARIGSWEWDIPQNSVWWSDELYRIYGLAPGSIEPSYERFLQYVHEDDRESVDARNHKAFADHEPFEDIKRIVRADGVEILMRTQGEVVCDTDGNPLRMIGICEDVTAEVHAREADRHLAAADAVRHRAFEINDEIIQRLVLASTYLDAGETDKSAEALAEARRSAQKIADELLADAPEPGELRRGSAAV